MRARGRGRAAGRAGCDALWPPVGTGMDAMVSCWSDKLLQEWLQPRVLELLQANRKSSRLEPLLQEQLLLRQFAGRQRTPLRLAARRASSTAQIGSAPV